jgi:hypothetical protein
LKAMNRPYQSGEIKGIVITRRKRAAHFLAVGVRL